MFDRHSALLLSKNAETAKRDKMCSESVLGSVAGVAEIELILADPVSIPGSVTSDF